MHFNTISGRHGGVPYSGVEIRRRTHTLLEFLFIHFELKKVDFGFTLCLANVKYVPNSVMEPLAVLASAWAFSS